MFDTALNNRTDEILAMEEHVKCFDLLVPCIKDFTDGTDLYRRCVDDVVLVCVVPEQSCGALSSALTPGFSRDHRNHRVS